MGLKLLNLCVAVLVLCPLKAGSIRASCGLPELSEHVTLTEERRTFPHGSKVTVECVHGYEPVDATVSKTITCEETKWTKLLLTCKKMYSVKCQAPPIIENGQIEAVFYKCNSGFFLNGRSSLYCSEDGTFNQDLPKCLEGSVCDGICLGKQRSKHTYSDKVATNNQEYPL